MDPEAGQSEAESVDEDQCCKHRPALRSAVNFVLMSFKEFGYPLSKAHPNPQSINPPAKCISRRKRSTLELSETFRTDLNVSNFYLALYKQHVHYLSLAHRIDFSD